MTSISRAWSMNFWRLAVGTAMTNPSM